ncbi:MAG: PAS domain-containing protein [Anaerolineales bacterium]|nr:PAS domain-containing protein [Anaerolineales bacterium]
MPTESTPRNPIARFLKPVPYHEFFRVLADSLESAVLILSEDGERILAWNHAFLLLSGYARTDLESLTPSELYPDEAGEQALGEILESWELPELALQDVPLLTQEGAITLVDIQVSPIGPSRSAFLLVSHPSSARQRTLEHRRAQEERLQTFVQMSSLLLEKGVSGFPAALDLVKQVLIAASVGLYRISAAAPEYILEGEMGSEFPHVLPTAELGPLQRSTAWIIGQRPEHPLQKAARTAGLSALRCTLLGSPSAWVGILLAGWRDQEAIPEDAEALSFVIANLFHAAILLSIQKASLANTERNLNNLEAETNGQFEAITDTLITLDKKLRVLQSNSAISRSLGYQPEEIEGLPIQDVLVGPEDITATLLDAVGHNRLAEQQRVHLHRRDGTRLPFHLRAFPFPDQAKSRLLLILKDQSEQQAIEDQTEILAQRALLGEVMAIFAHEVRNPINNISTGVQLAASRLGEDHPLHESLQIVQKECTRLDQLMSDVLFFSRPLELKIEPLDLAQMMERILARWTPRFSQADVTYHKSFDEETPTASADARTLEQVVVNLITNALEAMPEGGTLSVALNPKEVAQGKMVELKIADTGPGIPPDVIDRIFDPFFTTKKDGTGLGLAISRRIMTAHQGNIHVESYPDAGTVFSICLPIADSDGGSDT